MDVERLLATRRFWFLIGLAALYHAGIPAQPHPPKLYPRDEEGVGGFFVVSHLLSFALLAPILAGALTGDLLAWELRERRANLLLVRGLTRGRYLLAKALSMALVSAFAMLLLFGLFYVASAFFLPWRGYRLHVEPGVAPFTMGPVRSLFLTNPWLNDLLAAAMLAFAAGLLSWVSLPFSVLWKNVYVSAAAPFSVMLAFAATVRNSAPQPLAFLEVWGTSYQEHVPPAWRAIAAFLYWSVFGAPFLGLAMAIFLRKELE